jgi:hypothetical protein
MLSWLVISLFHGGLVDVVAHSAVKLVEADASIVLIACLRML